MSTRDDGGPAFPVSTGMTDQAGNPTVPGMSLRDWFAGQVLAGMFASGESFDHLSIPQTARMAYEAADAMLEDRKEG